jgi:tight adherence protein B
MAKPFERHMTQWRHRRRCRAFEAGLVDGLTFLNNALRAGLGVAQAIDLVARETVGAFAEECQRIIARVQVGVRLTEALQESAARLPVPDWQMAVEACLILMEMGGNLIEGFQLILEMIRDRQRVTMKIRTITAEGRTQAIIISVMPFGMGLLLYALAPDYMAPLLHNPMGWGIVVLGLLMLVAGVLWMRWILDLEV